MRTIKKVGVASVGYICALFYFLLGAIMAIIALVGFYNPALKAGMHENTVALISYLKYSILIVFPLIYAMLGFVLGVVAAFF